MSVSADNFARECRGLRLDKFRFSLDHKALQYKLLSIHRVINSISYSFFDLKVPIDFLFFFSK